MTSPPDTPATRAHLWRILAVTALALLLRLPYWQTIPAAYDETQQAVVAWRIYQGLELPLVGNDSYAGPVFFYLLAGLFAAGVRDPLVGRAVMLVAGTLVVPLSYLLALRLTDNKLASTLAALLVATNAPLIVLNSHVGGTTFLMPLFTTLALWLLAEGLHRDHWGWLLGAGVAAGLALQANALAVLLLAGAWLWLLLQTRGKQTVGRRWPFWPIASGLVIVAVLSPVLLYNLQVRLDSVAELQARSYLWETNPTLYTWLNNQWRLTLQLLRQTAGVLLGHEDLRTVLGIPLLFAAWLVAGIVALGRKTTWLPLLALLPFYFVLTWISSHYGLVLPLRFTTLLTPLLAAGMGLVAAQGWQRLQHSRLPLRVAGSVIVLTLIVYPLWGLSRYYNDYRSRALDGAAILSLTRDMMSNWQGETIFISNTIDMRYIDGFPYVPQAYAIINDIPHAFIPPDEIVGRLYALNGAAFLFLGDDEAGTIGAFAPLQRWPAAANDNAAARNYGLYRLDADASLQRPDFVLADATPQQPLAATVGSTDGIRLLGYDVVGDPAPGASLAIDLYWRDNGGLPPADYMGFVHLYRPDTDDIVAQYDHLLGQSQYPVGAWQPGEIIRDSYPITVPSDLPPGDYRLRAGVYTWPDLTRVVVPDAANNVIELGGVTIRQP